MAIDAGAHATPTSFMGGLGGFGAMASTGMMAPGAAAPGMGAMGMGAPMGAPMGGGGGFMGGMMSTLTGAPAAGLPPGANPFPGPAELIPNPMPQMGGPEPAEVASNQLGIGVAASAAIGVLLGCILFRKGGQAPDGDSDEDLQSDEDSK